MGIHVHLIRLNLIAHKSQQYFDLGRRPSTKTREQRQRVTVDGAAEELHAEVAPDLLQAAILRPGADGADFLVHVDIREESIVQKRFEFGEQVKDHAVGVGDAVKFSLWCSLDFFR